MMARLIVNPHSPTAWEVQLKPGLNFIGRGENNDISIDDASVSTRHCRVLVENGSVSVEDLGSTNGTFLDDAPITRAFAQPGQTIRVGAVPLLLKTATAEGEPAIPDKRGQSVNFERVDTSTVAMKPRPAEDHEPHPSPTLNSPAAAESDKPIFCKNHYQNLARFFCPKCLRHFCDLCVNTRGSAAGGLKFCKVCATGCLPVAVRPIERQVEFFAEAREAFHYPFRADGWILLLGGTFFFGFLDLANYVARHSFAYALRAMMMRVMIFTFILGCGYLFSYLKKIITFTAHGDQNMPDWPELTEWKEDIVSPMFQFLMISLFSFGPAFLAWLLMDFWFDVDYPWLVWLIALAGCLYFPMAFLGVAMFDSLAAAHPLFVASSISVVPREYSVAVLVFAGILLLRLLSETLLTMLLHIPLVPVLLSDLLAIGLLMVEARILGLLYLARKRTLGWFKSTR